MSRFNRRRHGRSGSEGEQAPTSTMATTTPLGDRVTLTIAQDGRSDFTILLPGDPSPSEQRAAAELQAFLQQITGARLPILREDTPGQSPSTRAIALGSTRLLR